MGFPAVPVRRISMKARQIDVAEALLTAVVAVLRLVGTILVGIPYWAFWSLSKAWLGVTLLGTAAVEGWRDARRGKGGERS